MSRSICSSRHEFPATEVRLDAVMLVVQCEDLREDEDGDDEDPTAEAAAASAAIAAADELTLVGSASGMMMIEMSARDVDSRYQNLECLLVVNSTVQGAVQSQRPAGYLIRSAVSTATRRRSHDDVRLPLVTWQNQTGHVSVLDSASDVELYILMESPFLTSHFFVPNSLTEPSR